MAATLEPLARDSTASIIADKIRAGIRDGLFTPGQQLGEVQLAGQLGVSRGLLREAMQRLVQEGLLRSERYRGLFVIELDDDDVWDVYLAREAVERAAVRALLRRNDPDLLEPLGRIVKQMSSAAKRRRGASLAELDLGFHAALVDASGSPRLKRVMQALVVETGICLRGLEGRYPDPSERVGEHQQILAALTERDEPLALQLVSAHMADAVDRLSTGR
jgi:DNA-binding GntR family transcriptional regulator